KGSDQNAFISSMVPELQSVAPVSAEVWFKPSHDAPVAGEYHYLIEWLQTGGIRGMSIATENGRLLVALGDWVQVGTVQPDQWYHVVVAKDEAEIRVYLNGTRVYTSSTDPFNGIQQTPIAIGASA